MLQCRHKCETVHRHSRPTFLDEKSKSFLNESILGVYVANIAPVQSVIKYLEQNSCDPNCLSSVREIAQGRERWSNQSRQFVRKMPFCSVMISLEVESAIMKPNLSILLEISGWRLGSNVMSIKQMYEHISYGKSVYLSSRMTLSCPPAFTTAWKSKCVIPNVSPSTLCASCTCRTYAAVKTASFSLLPNKLIAWVGPYSSVS